MNEATPKQSETAERLLDLGESLIRVRGYAGFSYADIASQAAIRKASIHYHYPTKADFGLAVLERYAGKLQRDLEGIAAASRTGGQALFRMIELYRVALGEGDHMCLCAALTSDSALLSEAMRDRLHRSNLQIVGWLAEVLLQGRRDRSISVGGDPQDEAQAILALLQGAQLVARASGDPTAFDASLAVLQARIIRH